MSAEFLARCRFNVLYGQLEPGGSVIGRFADDPERPLCFIERP